jgi:hypothetical protein
MIAITSLPKPLKNTAITILVMLVAFEALASVFTVLARPANDFTSFLVSGALATNHQNPYTITADVPRVLTGGAYGSTVNLNPPALLPLFEWIGRFHPLQLQRIWAVVSLSLYAFALWLLWRFGSSPRRRLLWAVALTGFWGTIELGQIYIPLMLAATVGLLLLQRGRRTETGILIGLIVTIKPQMAVWAGLLLLGGYWSIAMSAGVTAALLSALPVLLYGPNIYHQWLTVLHPSVGAEFPQNASLFAVGLRLDSPALGWLLMAVAALIASYIVWRRRADATTLSTIGIALALLLSPINWLGYTILLVPPLLLIKLWPKWLTVGACMLLVPTPIVWGAYLLPRPLFATLGSFYCIALLLILGSLLHEVWIHRDPTVDQPCMISAVDVEQTTPGGVTSKVNACLRRLLGAGAVAAMSSSTSSIRSLTGTG